MRDRKKAEKITFASEKDVPLVPMSLGSMLYNKTGAWRNIRPVIDLANCTQCGICWKFCPDEAIPAYPITPQTQVGELLSEMCAAKKLDAKFIKVESEHSAMAACIAASMAGARTFTATSAPGLAPP